MVVGIERVDGGPRSVIVVGAGIAGLSTAWFLQERGVEVTVIDGAILGTGASCGNAGWIAPGLTVPLNSPAVLRYGLRSLLDSRAPLHIPPRPDPKLARFLLQFAANCRRSPRMRAVQANVPFNEECIEAFEVLVGSGVDAPVTDAPITALFRTGESAQRMMAQLGELENAGQAMDVTALTGAALWEQVPLAARSLTIGLNINGQRFVDPGRFVEALCRAVIERGATTHRLHIVGIGTSGTGVAVLPSQGTALKADAVVIATGARLSQLAGRWMRVPVRAGRGYSFTVPVDRAVPGPIYLPEARVACTPYRGMLRVAGTMEFREPHEPARRERVDAIVASASPLLDGVRWAERSDMWVGARPVTPDGRPVIGAVAPDVYVAGGHGMWGFAHGPVTGRLLAEQITTGKQPQELRAFDPLRRPGR